MRTCTKCGEAKPLSAYWPDKRRKSGLQARCKDCRSEDRRAWRKRNPDADKKRYWANPVKERERHLVRKYGVTLEEYARRYREQRGRCAVCRKEQERALDVDHDHKTGAVRGLLCTSCNRMIGHAGDNAGRLERAAAYLRSSRKSRQNL